MFSPRVLKPLGVGHDPVVKGSLADSGESVDGTCSVAILPKVANCLHLLLLAQNLEEFDVFL